MVLQREPVEAAIWGYAFAVGDQVTISIDVGDTVLSYTTTAEDGMPYTWHSKFVINCIGALIACI